MMRRTAWAGSAWALAATVTAAVLVGGPAWAAPSTTVVQGQVLRLVSIADWDAASSLLPGQPVEWDVTVSAAAPDPGTVSVGISATGDARLVVDARGCAQAWRESGCPAGETTLRSGWAIPRDGIEVGLIDMSDTQVAHLRFVIVLASDGTGSTQVRVHAHGAGESAVIGPEGGLATTGMSPVVLWALGAGLALLVAGAAVRAGRRRRTTAGSEQIGEERIGSERIGAEQIGEERQP